MSELASPPRSSSRSPSSEATWAWTHRALLTPGSKRLALVVMVGSAFFPVGGLGVDLCPFHRTTGLPCPGCGMSRALAALTQGDWVAALGLHPFVLVAWPLFVGLALLALAPSSVSARVGRWLDGRGEALARAYRIVLVAFVGFGALRLALMLIAGQGFP